MGEVTIKARADGPYRVEGPVRVIDADGNEFVSVRALREQAVLRQVAPARRIRVRRCSAACRVLGTLP